MLSCRLVMDNLDGASMSQSQISYRLSDFAGKPYVREFNEAVIALREGVMVAIAGIFVLEGKNFDVLK